MKNQLYLIIFNKEDTYIHYYKNNLYNRVDYSNQHNKASMLSLQNVRLKSFYLKNKIKILILKV